MDREEKRRFLSTEGAIALLVGIGVAVLDLDWIVRGLLVVFGIAVIVHLSIRMPVNILLRAATAATGASIFIALSWSPIAEDFARKYPKVAEPPPSRQVPQSNAKNPTNNIILDHFQPPSPEKLAEIVSPAENVSRNRDGSKRIFVDTSFAAIKSEFSEHTEIQGQSAVRPYLGKWVAISGKIYDVLPAYGDGYNIFFWPDGTPSMNIIAYFSKSWSSQIDILHKDKIFDFACKILSISSVVIELDNCEPMDK